MRQQPLASGRSARRREIDERWLSLPQVATGIDTLARHPGALASLQAGSIAAVALDRLRGQMLRALREHGWRRIGICAPSPRCGTSFVAAGLAASFSRLEGLHVLLTDLGLDAPSLAPSLGLTAPCTVEDLLDPSLPVEARVQRVGDRLGLALADTPVEDAAGLAHAPDTALALRGMLDFLVPDIAIYDLPPLLGNAVTPALLPHMDAVMLVADGSRTTAREIADCERLLEGFAPLLGVILNKSDDAPPKPARQG